MEISRRAAAAGVRGVAVRFPYLRDGGGRLQPLRSKPRRAIVFPSTFHSDPFCGGSSEENLEPLAIGLFDLLARNPFSDSFKPAATPIPDQ
ncbi:unnamed protein product [Urochloa humidicola]